MSHGTGSERTDRAVSRRAVLGAGVAAAAGSALLAGPAAAAAAGEVGTAQESQAAGERGVECVADLR